MGHLLYDHFPLFFSVLLIAMAMFGRAAFRAFSKPVEFMPDNSAPINDIDDLVNRFKSGELANQDDDTLSNAATKLSYAHKYFFDGIAISSLTVAELGHLQAKQRELRDISDSLWRLLTVRYGCND